VPEREFEVLNFELPIMAPVDLLPLALLLDSSLLSSIGSS
jgi:hypothetical protein